MLKVAWSHTPIQLKHVLRRSQSNTRTMAMERQVLLQVFIVIALFNQYVHGQGRPAGGAAASSSSSSGGVSSRGGGGEYYGGSNAPYTGELIKVDGIPGGAIHPLWVPLYKFVRGILGGNRKYAKDRTFVVK